MARKYLVEYEVIVTKKPVDDEPLGAAGWVVVIFFLIGVLWVVGRIFGGH